MPYATKIGYSRTKTLTATGTMTLGLRKTEVTSGGGRINKVRCLSYAEALFGTFGIRCDAVSQRVSGPSTQYGVQVQMGLSTNQFQFVDSYLTALDPLTVNRDYPITWSISVDCCLRHTWQATNTLLGTGGPLFEGSDALTMEWVGQDATTPFGAGSYTLTVVINGIHTITETGTVPSGIVLRPYNLGSDIYEDMVQCYVQCYSFGTSFDGSLDYSNAAAVSWNYSNAILSTGQTYTYTACGATQSVVYAGQSISVSSDANTAPTSITDANPQGRARVSPVRSILFKGLIASLTEPLSVGATVLSPDVTLSGIGASADTTITATGAQFSGTYTQRFERIYNIVANNNNNLNTTLYGYIGASLPVSWMGNANGYANVSVGAGTNYGGKLLLKDKLITSALTLALASTNTLPSGTDTSVSGGLRRTWGTLVGLTTYRYLSVGLGSGSLTAGTVKIIRDSGASVGMTTSYEWTQDRDGTALTGAGPFVIDLLAPTNRTVTVDATPSTWPEDTNGFRLGEGWMSGPSWLDRLEVIDADTFTLGAIQLVRASSPASLVCAISQQNAYQAKTGVGLGASPVRRRPFLTACVDGRVEAISETDVDATVGVGVVSGLLCNSIEELATILTHARNRGVSATVGAPPPTGIGSHPWYNRELPCVGLLGSGWIFRPATQTWESTLDSAMGAMDYQLGVPSVVFPGNLGDLFGHENTGTLTGTTQVVAVATLHSRAYGAVLGESGAPESGVSIGVRTRAGYGITAPEERGSGLSDSLGYFAAGEDWMRGNVIPHDAYSESDTAVITIGPRRLFPVRFVAPPSFLGLDNHNPWAGQYFTAVPEGGAIRLRRWDFSVPSSSTPNTSLLVTSPTGGAQDRQPCLWSAGQERLSLLFWRKGGSGTAGIYEQYTDDNGATWSTPAMAIANAQQPDAAIDISGGVLRAGWVQDTGSVGFLKATWQAPGDASESAVFTFTNTSGGANLRVKNTGFSISAAPAGGSEFLLTCTIEGESSTSEWKSSDDGRSWTRI